MHDILWEAIRRLEQIGLHVVALTCDGAKPNRKFYKDHFHKECTKNGVVYKAPNIYRPGAYVYFFSDVPHLIKTTRNAWANSTSNGTRRLWVKKFDFILIVGIIDACMHTDKRTGHQVASFDVTV